MNGGTETALVIGATSDIGRAVVRRLADSGYRMQLAAWTPAWLEREARDIRVRTGIAATEYPCDILRDGNGLSLSMNSILCLMQRCASSDCLAIKRKASGTLLRQNGSCEPTMLARRCLWERWRSGSNGAAAAWWSV